MSAVTPIFVVGCHRSGTTLLRFLLDSHPRLACPPETKLVPALRAFVKYPQLIPGLMSLGLSVDHVLEGCRRTVEGVMDTYAARHGKRRWIDKTPNNYRLLPFIDRMFKCEPQYVLLVRHPLDTIASLRRHTAELRTDPDVSAAVASGGVFDGLVRYWLDVNTRLLGFAARVPHRTVVIRYEDLVTRPRDTLTEILTFLGERMVDGLIERAFADPHAHGYEDWNIRGTTAIHADSIGKGRCWTPAEMQKIWDVVGPVAVRLGYELAVERPAHADMMSTTSQVEPPADLR